MRLKEGEIIDGAKKATEQANTAEMSFNARLSARNVRMFTMTPFVAS